MVRITGKYVFDGPDGPVSLADLFGGRSQLIIQHVMFDPGWAAACPGFTASVDALPARVLAHLRSCDTAFALVSRAPLAKLEAYRAARGWTAPWHSSLGTGFKYDFQVTLDKSAGWCSAITGTAPPPLTTMSPARSRSSAASCVTAMRSSTPIRPTPGARRIWSRLRAAGLTAFGRSEGCTARIRRSRT
jgi:predicted dithiol-disulfide oxidoreductase (DUF899 family)